MSTIELPRQLLSDANGLHHQPSLHPVPKSSSQPLSQLNRGPRLLIAQLIYPAILAQDMSKANLAVNLVHALSIGLSCALGTKDKILQQVNICLVNGSCNTYHFFKG